MRRILTAAFLLLALGRAAFAVGPSPVSSQDLSGTIAVTSTFQTIQLGNTSRSGCRIQNNGTNVMSVRFGGGAALKLIAGATMFCESGNIVLSDKVEITGTAADAFTAYFQ